VLGLVSTCDRALYRVDGAFISSMLPQPDPHTTPDRQMGVREPNSLFQVFPNELVSTILAMLEYRDLASCMRVRGMSFLSPISPANHTAPDSDIGRCANACAI
jgi:hypothetical protein